MNKIENKLAFFNAIALEKLDALELMKRYDTKYLFHKEMLPSIFEYLCQYYKILEIDKKRSFKYENLYYDTDDYLFYHQHHNKKMNRHKIRHRRYVDSGKCYFEIKLKNNKNKTVKTRLKLNNRDLFGKLNEDSKSFAREHLICADKSLVDMIRPGLKVDYNRITLANQINKERLTFDTDLTYIDKYFQVHKISNMVIAELKQEDISRNSPFIKCFSDLKIYPANFSKYCMGIALTEKNIKTNRFKMRLLTLQKYI